MKLDHIAFVAQSLEQAQAYASQLFGVELPAGGKHPLMGTHNLVTRIAPGVFLEFIAIDPEAPPPNRTRWFALDRLMREGTLEEVPRLFGWVASVPDLARNASESPQHALLEVTRGDLRWHFFHRKDGEAEAGGCWPALIDWAGGQSPVDRMQDVGLRLHQFQLAHPEVTAIREKLHQLGWDAAGAENRSVALTDAARPGLTLVLDTPNGRVQIEGGGL
ncbi:VOC family protein [Ralstonia sp. 22111]|uniref:VOC family protein n=1 Tax=Ralstonia sp. 22111 TaxID=3453878 RepID=UPI003F842296